MAPKPVILSESEKYFANWMRSLHCGRDDINGNSAKINSVKTIKWK